MRSWLLENICDFISSAIGGTVDFFGELVNNIFYFIVDYGVNNAYVVGAQKLLVSVALALVSLMVLKIVISGYLLETDYDSEADPFNLLVRLAETVAIITNSGWLFNYLLNASKDFTTDVIGSVAETGYADQTRSLVSVDLSGMANMLLPYLAMIALILVAIIIFTVVAGLRGGELILMNLLLPVFAIDLLTSSRERWNNFIMGYFTAFFTYGIQILLYNVALKSYATASYSEPLYFITAVTFLIMAIRTPKFLERYLYRSGVSTAATSGMRLVFQTAVMKR